MVFVSMTEVISISRSSLQAIFHSCWRKTHFTAVMLGKANMAGKGCLRASVQSSSQVQSL
jgi:hypothetical protein